MERKLTKSREKYLCGVCGGIAEYFLIDPTIIRIITALSALFLGIFPVAVVYFIAAIFMPAKY